VSRDAGITTGFDGAIQRLAVNGEVYSDLATRMIAKSGVVQYSGSPCGGVSNSPCRNGGICHPRLSQYSCKCPPRYIGVHCEERELMYTLYCLSTLLKRTFLFYRYW
jgi:hypothetical protein